MIRLTVITVGIAIGLAIFSVLLLQEVISDWRAKPW